MELLQQEAKLEEIVRLVGMDALSPKERLILETSKSIREDFLFQNAFDPDDAYTPLQKQYWILKSIMTVYREAFKIVDRENFEFNDFLELPVLQKVVKCKEIAPDKLEEFEALGIEIANAISQLGSRAAAK